LARDDFLADCREQGPRILGESEDASLGLGEKPPQAGEAPRPGGEFVPGFHTVPPLEQHGHCIPAAGLRRPLIVTARRGR
jgi:hypothetical protein